MGLFDFFGKQFIDVIEWTENSNGLLAYRYPTVDREIQNGAKLTVRDTQVALFVHKGQVADIFEPGLHTLATENLPILSSLQNWDKMFKSPFKSEVYFFSTRDQLDQRWGTQTPITIRDKDFGSIRLRTHGTFSFKLRQPKVFYQKVSGTRESYTTEELSGQLRSMTLANLGAFLGSSQTSFLDMASNQMKFSEILKTALAPSFEDYGLELKTFFVQSISLPEELQSYLDKNSSMNMLGDLRKYAQFQAADSLGAAARNEGGAAGAGLGLGAGIMMGQTMSQSLSGNFGQPAAGAAEQDPLAVIQKLHDLMSKGAITQAEFEAKKAELLKNIK
ncbi:MAG: SPFH domain-containing protein [Pseudobdellovibrionaceae bacterium]